MRSRRARFSLQVFSVLLGLSLQLRTTAQTGMSFSEPSTNVLTNADIPESNPQTFLTKVREVNVLFSAMDWRGRFVSDLNQSDVTVFDNGKRLPSITYFLREENLPLEVGILIDVSASVANVFRAQQKAATLFLQQTLRPADKASLIAFGIDTRMVQDFTPSLTLLSSAIGDLRVGDSSTAIYDAVQTSCERLAKGRQSELTRRALILITDGEDNASKSTLQDAVAAALRSEVVVFALNTNVQPEWTDQSLKQLAESSGGTLLHAAGEKALRSAFGRVNEQLRSQYLLGYKPPHVDAQSTFHRIRLTSHKFGMHIYCRKGYYVAD